MRIAKYLARAGVASRRRAELIIREGRVTVNGAVATVPQHPVTGSDRVLVDGKPVAGRQQAVYLLLNKPAGYLSTVRDTHGRPTVMDLLGGLHERVYPVGRLDRDTTGILLLTNDGELAYRLTHPRYGVEKKYRALVKGKVEPGTLRLLSRGQVIDGRETSPARVRLLQSGEQSSLLEITLREGRKRQVRKMCEGVGHPVISLQRTGFAFLNGSGLKPGSYRHLTEKEVKRLYSLVNLSRN